MTMKKWLLSSAAFGVFAAASPAIAAPPPPPPPAFYSWEGFYIGGTFGYSWGNGQVTYNEPVLANFGLPTSFSGAQHLNGVIGGPEIGYNVLLSPTWLVGFETDFQWSGERASSSFSDPYVTACDTEGCHPITSTFSGTLSSNILWFGTLRGRIGELISPTVLLYGTAGLAYGKVSVTGSFSDTFCTPPCTWSFNQSAIKVGLTLGGGVEGVIPNTNWAWKAEYLYLDLGSLSGTGFDTDFGGTYTWNAKFTDNIFRVGVIYNFSPGWAPP